MTTPYDKLDPLEKTNETWNTCPACLDLWRDETPDPGVIHRTKLCHRCARLKASGVPIREIKPFSYPFTPDDIRRR